jgi:hypothetical protein
MIRRSRSDLDSTAQIISRFRISISAFLLHCFLPLQVAIHETPKWSWINGPDLILIQRLRSYRDFAYRDFDILVALFLASPSRDSRNSEMESDQRSRSDLDSTAAIKSRFRISRFRHSCGLFLASPSRDPRNSEMESDQRSTIDGQDLF